METKQLAIPNKNNKLIMNKLGASFFIMFLVGAMLPLVNFGEWSTETISLYNLVKPTVLMIVAAFGVLVYASGINKTVGRLISLTFIALIVEANLSQLQDIYELITSGGRNFDFKDMLRDIDKLLSTLPIPRRELISVASVLLIISFIGIIGGIFSPRYKERKQVRNTVTNHKDNVATESESVTKVAPQKVIESPTIESHIDNDNDNDNIIFGKNRIGWYLHKASAYILAFNFILVTGIADYIIYALSDEKFSIPIVSIAFLIWNIKRVYKDEIFQQKLPEGAVIKLVDKKEFPLAYSIFSLHSPINRSVEIYRCIGLDDYCKSSITPKKAVLYIDEESFQKMLTDKKIFYRFIEEFVVRSSSNLSYLALDKISFRSTMGNMIKGSASSIQKLNENNNDKTRLIMGAAIAGTTGAAVASIVIPGTTMKKASYSPALIFAMGYVLFSVIILLIMLPFMTYFHYKIITKAREPLITEIFNNDKNEFKKFRANLDNMVSPEFDDIDTYTQENGWYKY